MTRCSEDRGIPTGRGEVECQPPSAALFPNPCVRFRAQTEMALSRSPWECGYVQVPLWPTGCRPLAIGKATWSRSTDNLERDQRPSKGDGWPSGQALSPVHSDTGPLGQRDQLQNPLPGTSRLGLVGQNIQVKSPQVQPLSRAGERQLNLQPYADWPVLAKPSHFTPFIHVRDSTHRAEPASCLRLQRQGERARTVALCLPSCVSSGELHDLSQSLLPRLLQSHNNKKHLWVVVMIR